MQQETTRTEIQGVNSNSEAIGRLARSGGITLIGRVGGGFLHFVTQISLARLLGPELLGLYTLGFSFIRLGSLISPLGLPKGALRFAYRYWARDDENGVRAVACTALGLALASGLVLAVVMYFAAPWLAIDVFRRPELARTLRAFGIAMPFVNVLLVAAHLTMLTQQMQYLILSVDIAQPLSNLALFLILFAFGLRLSGAVAATVISYVVGSALALYFLVVILRAHRLKFAGASIKHDTPPPRFSVRDLLTFSVPTSLAGTFAVMMIWTDRLMVGYFLDDAQVGIYQTATQFSLPFTVILSALTTSITPMVVALHQKGQLAQLDELYKINTKWGLYVCLPAFVVLFITPIEAISVLFGPEYTSGWATMVILGIGQLINVATGAVGVVMVMTGHQKPWLWISSGMMILNLTMNAILIPRLGLSGAAVSTAFSLFGMFGLGITYNRLALGIWPYDRRILRGLVIALLVGGFVIGFKMLILAPMAPSSLLTLFVVTVLSLGLYLALMLLWGLDDEELTIIRQVRARLARAA